MNETEDLEEDSSSPKYEFVDATQNHGETNSDEGIELTNAGISQITQETVQNDMEFLNQSWANIMENEKAEERLLAELEKEHPKDVQLQPIINDGFQLAQSKSQKKAPKNKERLNKELYQTRSRKVDHPKPFK